MNVRRKSFLFISIILGTVLAIIYLFAHVIILQGFLKLEQEEVNVNTNRASEALYSEIGTIDRTTNDYAAWDDSYDFIKTKNQKFIESSLADYAFISNKLNIVVYVDVNGGVVFQKAYDLEKQKEIPLPYAFSSLLEKKAFTNTKIANTSGIILIPEVPVLLAARPITTSEGKGPVRGTLIMAKFLNSTEVKSLESITKLVIDIETFDNKNLPNLLDLSEAKRNNSVIVQSVIDDNYIASYKVFGDLNNQPALLMKVTSSRTIYQHAIQTISSFIIAITILGIILILSTTTMIDKLIISRIDKVTQAVDSIGKTLDFNTPLPFAGSDELGSLVGTVNLLLDKLASSQENLNQQSLELKKNYDQIQKKNDDLEATKRAMLNILEDTHRLQDQLKAERDRSMAIISSMGEGLIVIDKHMKIVQINPAAQKLLDLTQMEVIGKEINKYFSLLQGDKTMAEENRPLTKTLETGQITITGLKDDLYFSTHTGKKVPAAISTAPVIGEGMNGAVVLLRDISKEKEIDRMKTEFVSVAAHQLRTPLGSIRWNLEMLISGDFGKISKPIFDTLSEVYGGIQRMIGLVNNLLDVSRIDQGRVQNTPIPINMSNIINQCLNTLKLDLQKHDIGLELHLEKDIESSNINVDPKLFYEVVMNLLSNALKYNKEKGKIIITVSTDKQSKVLEVEVTGIGIPLKDQKRIFSQFFRAQNAVISETEGTGLGLYVVKSYIESWKGKVSFRSIEGKGTKFTIELPLFRTKS